MIDFNRLRPVTIGFDDIFDTMEAIVGQPIAKTQYPPYDIVKIDDYKFSLQLAVAGFRKKFTVADNVVVNDAELRDGLLVIELEKILPEGKKPRTIEIK
jgi:molecular chaperone IbpA